MDEDHYRATYGTVNERRCYFEKAILTRQVHCSRANIFCLAERQGVACQSEVAQKQCESLLIEMRLRSKFALGMSSIDEQLPHAKEIKIQRGGLIGMSLALDPEAVDADPVADVHGLVNSMIDKYGSVASFPYAEIVKSVVKFQGRKKRR